MNNLIIPGQGEFGYDIPAVELSLAINNLIIPGQGEFGYARLVTSQLRTGKSLTFFYSVGPEMVLPDYSGRCNCSIRLGHYCTHALLSSFVSTSA